jgi:glutamine amidotransferase
MLIHNGQIGGYARLRRQLESQLPDALFEHRRGATDSELLFLLIVQQLQAGTSAPEALRNVLASTHAAMQQAGIDEPLRFAAALTDGDTLWAIRWASDDQPPSLYTKPQAGGWAIASEPLGDDSEHWTPLAPGEMVRVWRGEMERVGAG